MTLANGDDVGEYHFSLRIYPSTSKFYFVIFIKSNGGVCFIANFDICCLTLRFLVY